MMSHCEIVSVALCFLRTFSSFTHSALRLNMMQPDFAGPFVSGVLHGVVKLLPALVIVATIMVAFWFLKRRQRGARQTRR
jgi:hypothetical protein